MNRRAILLVAWIALVAGAVAGFHGQALDDIFITYRYAYNLAHGRGFVFNPGERVFGVTDPGVAAILAGLTRVTGVAIPELGTALTGLALLGIAVPLLRLGRALGRELEAAVAGTLLVTSGYLWIGQGAGPLPALALLVLASTVAESRPALAGALAGCAACVRPDAAVGAGVLGALLWAATRRLPGRYALGAAGVALPAALLARIYFGSFIPNTLGAKRQLAALAARQPGAVPAFWRQALDLFDFYAGPLGVVLVALGLLGLWALMRGGGLTGRLLALHGAILGLFYTVVGVPFFLWYTFPLVVALLYGAAFLVGDCGRLRPVGRGLVAALLVASWGLGTARWWGSRDDIEWRLRAYRAAGEWIRGHSPATADVAFDEVGMLAYFADRTVQDLNGLVTLRALPFAAVGDAAGAFLAKPAEFVVFHTYLPRGGTRPIVTRPWFASSYREVVHLHDAKAGAEVFVFERRPASTVPPPRAPQPRPRPELGQS